MNVNEKPTEKNSGEEQIIREMDTEESVNGGVDIEELISEADTSILDIFSALIRGTDFDLGNGMEFHFGLNGEYAGYIDADNVSVEDYTYEVTIKDNVYMLFLYNEDKSKYIEYQMSFDSNGNIMLTHAGMDQTLLLVF